MGFQESETVELKTIVVDDIKKEIIAFANCEGGKLYIGVRDDGTVIGVNDPDGTALQVSNMVGDAVKPDLTMFLHYETLNIDGKQIVSIDIQQGTERPYYIAKKGLRPEGVYVRQGYSSVPATNTAIRCMIKETDGDHFEEMRSLEQNLTFKAAKKEFLQRNILFGQTQMKTLGIMSHDGIFFSFRSPPDIRQYPHSTLDLLLRKRRITNNYHRLIFPAADTVFRQGIYADTRLTGQRNKLLFCPIPFHLQYDMNAGPFSENPPDSFHLPKLPKQYVMLALVQCPHLIQMPFKISPLHKKLQHPLIGPGNRTGKVPAHLLISFQKRNRQH